MESRNLCIENTPSVLIAKVGDTSGGHRAELEAWGFTATCASAEYLTVRTREDVTQSPTLSADQASQQRVISGGPGVLVMQTANLLDGDGAAATRGLDLSRNRRVSIE